MTINGIQFDVDFTDADIIEKIEQGSKKVYEEAARTKEQILTPAEGIRQECKIMKEFLDYVLGEGASKKIFGEKDSLKDCLQVFENVINQKEEQYNTILNKVNLYSPERVDR